MILFLVCSAAGSAWGAEAEAGGYVLEAKEISAARTPSGDLKGRGLGNAELAHGETRLTSDLIEIDTGTGDVSASGSVRFSDPLGTLTAKDLTYNFNTRTGRITQPVARQGPLIVRGEMGLAEQGVFRILDASATACDREPPDYRVSAREISLTPDSRLTARKVSVWLGGTRLLQIPRLSVKVGNKDVRRTLLPRLGYEGVTGPFIGAGFPIVSSSSQYLDFTARLTLHYGFEGSISSERLLLGSSRGPLAPAVIGPMLDLQSLPLIRTASGGTEMPGGQALEGSQVRLFANIGCNQRAYDIDVKKLRVSRVPELGVKYIAPAIQIATPALSVGGLAESSALISYGRLSEQPGRSNVDRFDARGFLSVYLANLGRRTALQTTLLARYSSYDSGESYRVLGGSINLARIIGRESYATARYVKHRTWGSTPLEMDDVDILDAVQGALWYRFGRNLIGGQIDYDTERGKIYDWAVTYGRTFHCLEPRISWRNRFGAIGLDVQFVGF